MPAILMFCVAVLIFAVGSCNNPTTTKVPATPPKADGTTGMSDIFFYKSVSGQAVITGIKTSEKREPSDVNRDAAMQALTNLLDEQGILTMEESIDGLPIKEIDKNAFSFFARPPGSSKEQSSDTLAYAEGLLPPDIKGIFFPASLEKIGIDAFAGCEHLETIEFPANSTLKEIGNGAFYWAGLTGALELPASLKVMGRTVFYANKKITTADLSKTQLNTVRELMFTECIELVSIQLPPGTASIGESVFSKCNKLESIAFPAPLTLIDDYAFVDCKALTQVDFSALTAAQVKIGNANAYMLFSNAFKNTGLWGKLNDPNVWVKIPAGKTIDTSGGNSGFFAGHYGNFYDTGWNSLTGIVDKTTEKDKTWVKVYAGSKQVWPPGP